MLKNSSGVKSVPNIGELKNLGFGVRLGGIENRIDFRERINLA
jgi:hypothetical protein